MRSFFFKLQNHRYGLLALLTIILVSISFVTRFVLLFDSTGTLDLSLWTIVEAFVIGFFFDLANATYFIIPLALYLWLCPKRIYNKRWHSYVLRAILFLFVGLLIFNSFSEWFFWEEFRTRFNFIAVDYLVYTTEVVGNIRQSYPIEWLVAGALGITGVIVYCFRSWTNPPVKNF